MEAYRTKVLIVDDDPSARKILQGRLRIMNVQTLVASSGPEALEQIRRETPGIVLLDLQMPKMSGIDVLRSLKREGLGSTVIVVTAHATIEIAVEAMKEGAYDFITKPVDSQHLEIVLGKAFERESLRARNLSLQAEVEGRLVPIITTNPIMKHLLQLAQRAADSNSTILLLGESGTGKEVLARRIHWWSTRALYPFTVVNCVAIPDQLLESDLFGHEKGAFTGAYQLKKGKFEIADHGTVFLDEIGEIPVGIQTKLLRVLQDHEFERVGGTRAIKADIRVIAATNSDLERAVREGRFREDLYYRLNVVNIKLPPLRERKEDIPVLVDYFLRKYADELKKPVKQLASSTIDDLLAYHWPGNVRELENVIERAMVLSTGDRIGPEDLPLQITAGARRESFRGKEFHEGVKEFKRWVIQDAIKRSQGNQTKAAELLGLQRTYLAKLIRLLEVKADLGLTDKDRF
ncbi:Fis family transcriptional regulator [Candidatus Methylomirabilis lanthanidiphila]|uniref:DNA-binding transcriptional regulator NtrC n=1 Tax=Candidatus Methylomirabilis lanthanidiphila TaxID=2211376 RepID=A0A564ZJW3_9BACT|nr:sigma-54 dependent transcriptional regulator [Candidatus Methylomirabilis lanthanidiphila]VUZ85406.1 Fis family transcriptional regulator [Candidatus Methylomirabilis lanthanidiphila]